MNDQPLHWSLRVAAGVAIICLMLPVFVVVFASFSATAYLTIPPQGWTLHWFAQVLSDPTYLSAIAFSLELAVAATSVAANRRRYRVAATRLSRSSASIATRPTR